MIGHCEYPVSRFKIGDVVRIGNGRVEWTIVGMGATSGLSLRNELGTRRSAQAFDVTLVRGVDDAERAALDELILAERES